MPDLNRQARRLAWLATAAGALLAAGCAGRHAAAPAEAVRAPLTTAYAAAATAGRTVYRLDGAASQVLVLVGKTGPLAGAGHVHVMVVGRLRGFALVQGDMTRADLSFPVKGMSVDPPAARSALGGTYAERLDASARAGTRAHMLGPSVLDAARFPVVRISVTGPAPASSAHSLRALITLHGRTRPVTVPTALSTSADAITADGSFRVLQTDFGIRPYSILLGALKVKDALEIRYHLLFRRWCPSTQC